MLYISVKWYIIGSTKSQHKRFCRVRPHLQMNSCTFGSAFFASASCPVALSAVKARKAPAARPSPSALTILGITCGGHPVEVPMAGKNG